MRWKCRITTSTLDLTVSRTHKSWHRAPEAHRREPRQQSAKVELATVKLFGGGTMSDELEKLLEAAKHRPLTAEEKEEQRRSFAYGNVTIENDRVTRAMVDREAEALNNERNRPKL
jgi:hypothetical protein